MVTIALLMRFIGASWQTSIRTAAVMYVGAVLIGALCWPSIAPAEPFGIVSAGNFDGGGIVRLLALAFLSGLFAYFIAWPVGKQIAVLAAPAGLAVWSIRSGSMANLMQANSTLDARMAILAKLRWESFFWLAVVLAGFAGVYLASKITRPKKQKDGGAEEQRKIFGTEGFSADFKKLKAGIGNINILTAIFGSGVIAVLIILQLARGERFYDERLGYLIGQPDKGQITFAIITGFAGAGFAVKKFLGLSFFWSVLAVPVTAVFVSFIYASRATVEHITASWPAIFFANSMVAILPIELVSFGTLGAILGYLMAVRYEYWRQYES